MGEREDKHPRSGLYHPQFRWYNFISLPSPYLLPLLPSFLPPHPLIIFICSWIFTVRSSRWDRGHVQTHHRRTGGYTGGPRGGYDGVPFPSSQQNGISLSPLSSSLKFSLSYHSPCLACTVTLYSPLCSSIIYSSGVCCEETSDYIALDFIPYKKSIPSSNILLSLSLSPSPSPPVLLLFPLTLTNLLQRMLPEEANNTEFETPNQFTSTRHNGKLPTRFEVCLLLSSSPSLLLSISRLSRTFTGTTRVFINYYNLFP